MPPPLKNTFQILKILTNFFACTSPQSKCIKHISNPQKYDKLFMHVLLHNQSGYKRKGVQSLLMLAAWEIWCERNRRIFQQEELSIQGLLVRIRDEDALWNMAGASIPFDPG
jgi:hypothetical protein